MDNALEKLYIGKMRCIPIATNLSFLFYLSTVNLVSHTGSTLSVIFAIAGIVLFIGSDTTFDTTLAEKAVFAALLVFPAIYLISFVINNWPDLLRPKNLKHLEDEFRILLFFPVYFLFRKVNLSPGSLYGGILAGAVASGAYAIVCFAWTGGDRVSGPYDAIAFGDLSLILSVMSATSMDAIKERHPSYRYFVPAAFLLGLIASILSGTRGTWVAVPVLLVILFAYAGSYIELHKRLLLVGFCVSILIASYYIPATNVAQRVDSAIAEVDGYLKGDIQYGGATVRLLGLRAALEIYSKNPIVGVGPGNYRRVVNIMIKRGRLHEMTARHFLPSSIFLSTLATCGTLGFLALLGLFLAPLYLSIQLIRSGVNYRSVGYSLMMLVAGFFLFGLSEIVFRRSVFSSFYILLVAAFMAKAANIRAALAEPGATKNRST